MYTYQFVPIFLHMTEPAEAGVQFYKHTARDTGGRTPEQSGLNSDRPTCRSGGD